MTSRSGGTRQRVMHALNAGGLPSWPLAFLLGAACSAPSAPAAAPVLEKAEVPIGQIRGVHPGVPSASPRVLGPLLGVDHVGLTVTDLEASKAFFVDALEFKVVKYDPDYPAYILKNRDTKVTLWRAMDPAKARAFDRKNQVGLHHLALGVASLDALDALHERLKKYPGVRIEFAPELAYGGPDKHMMFREPSGNRMELVHRPPH